MAGIWVEGVEKVSVTLALIGKRSIAASREALLSTLRHVAVMERILLQLGSHPPGTKTGSLPGEPPWRISGNLVGSVGVGTPRMAASFRGLSWRGEVGASAVYAAIHEHGGWTGRNHSTYLPPRPHLRPAWNLVRPTVTPTFKYELTRATRPRGR